MCLALEHAVYNQRLVQCVGLHIINCRACMQGGDVLVRKNGLTMLMFGKKHRGCELAYVAESDPDYLVRQMHACKLMHP